jgi:hypothetical protein
MRAAICSTYLFIACSIAGCFFMRVTTGGVSSEYASGISGTCDDRSLLAHRS